MPGARTNFLRFLVRLRLLGVDKHLRSPHNSEMLAMTLGQKELHIPSSAKRPINESLDFDRVDETSRNHPVSTRLVGTSMMMQFGNSATSERQKSVPGPSQRKRATGFPGFVKPRFSANAAISSGDHP